ncbi:MAG: LysE family transporter [Bacteroidales bacterium]|jgi:threonine/homoserine/homoserine lactone efflux protein|nr:LysE family transporter [Bacteroidales bacterium]
MTVSSFLALLEGLLLGLPFVFAIGPALFSILQTSVNKGFYSGMQLAIGISISDILLMSSCYFGFAQNIESDKFQIALGIVGTVFLLIYGIYIFRKKKVASLQDRKEQINLNLKINWMGVFSEIGKGFVLNFMNPFLWVFWFTIISSGTAGKGKPDAILFMLGIAIMIFSTDLLKAFFANRITTLLSEKVLLIINKVAGILLILCAVVLFVRTCYTFHLIPFNL